MRYRLVPRTIAATLAIGSLTACARNPAPRAEKSVEVTASSRDTGLILQEGEGERRVRRNAAKGPFILKVDRQNGDSPDLVAGYEELAPGVDIQRHMHLVADEILFIHRGSGIATLGGRESVIRAGATIYIPRNVWISVRNTGTEPLGVLFVFSKPGFEQLMRENSVVEGQPVTPISPDEREQIRKRHSWHTVYPK